MGNYMNGLEKTVNNGEIIWRILDKLDSPPKHPSNAQCSWLCGLARSFVAFWMSLIHLPSIHPMLHDLGFVGFWGLGTCFPCDWRDSMTSIFSTLCTSSRD